MLDVFRRDGRIVDDDAKRLCAGLGRIVDHRPCDLDADASGLRGDVVDMGGGEFGEGSDVVEKREKSAHFISRSPMS